MKPAGRLGVVVVSLALGALSCDAPTAVVAGGAQLAWVSAPPATLREGDSATVIVELRDASGRPLLALDGAPVSLRFTFAQDSQPGTACGAACTTTVAQGRAQITVAWVSAGSWTAIACVQPAAADSACAQAPLTVLPVRAALVTYPADSVGRRVRFPVEARLRLPDGSPVTDLAPTVRLHFTSTAPAAGHVQCPEAGPVCERAPAAGVVRLDSVVVLDTAATTLEACAIAPNGHERCDPAGPRAFRVVVPQVTLHFATQPSGGSVGVPFATQPVIEALEPDGTRRADFTGKVDLALSVGAQAGAVLVGTGADGTTARGTVTLHAAAGAATPTDLRVNRAGDGYALVASAAGAVPDTSAAFDVPLDPAQLRMDAKDGNLQHALPGSLLHIAPSVLVTGPLSDPIGGVVVSFAVTEGGGSVAAATATTDLTGIATSGGWTLGPLTGSHTLTATATGFTGVSFHAYAHIDPEVLVFLTQPHDIAAGDTIRPAVVVALVDAQGRQLFGATDSVFLRTYDCAHYDPNSLDPCEVLGDEVADQRARAAVDGLATFDDLAVTHTRGLTVLVASVTSGHRRQSTVFEAYGGAAVSLGIWDGNNQNALAGTAVSTAPSVSLLDRYGNLSTRAHVTVTFAVTFGGGSVTDPVQTAGSGRARPGTWTLGPTPGINALSAKADGIADSVVFFATGTAPTFNASSIAAGWDFTCATAQTTNLPYCWGANTYSQLGEGTQTARSRPTQLAGGLLQLTQVTAGQDFACGLAASGSAYCWGKNWYGQLGIDTFDVVQHPTPEAVVGGHTFREISVGALHACALDTDGVAWCWGSGSTGALGSATLSTSPRRVNTLLTFTQIDAGALHSCAVAVSGDIWCWGSNDYGQLGDNSATSFSFTPVMVSGGRTYTQVSAGGWTTCGVSLGAVYCWGRNREGQVGTGTTSPGWELQPVPALGALGTTMGVAVGVTHTCALNSQGETYCWGANTHGELGDGTTVAHLTGGPISGGVLFVAITAGLNHTCGLRQSGATYCWGSNGSGRLGDGTVVQRTVPFQVAVP